MVESAPVRFKDGASYNTMMGGWSRAVGEQFVDWLQPAKGLDWIEVGCGSGAFTDLVVSSVAPRPVRDASTRSAQPALQGSRDRSWPICGSPREMLGAVAQRVARHNSSRSSLRARARRVVSLAGRFPHRSDTDSRQPLPV